MPVAPDLRPLITVIIATHNRVDSLDKLLLSFINQKINISEYEILIIDNGSTDCTPQLVSEHKKNLPNLGYIYSSIPSLTNARNIGWQHATGSIVVYTDDDVTLDPDWLQQIKRAHQLEGVDIVGGKITPVWESEKPPWLHKKLYGSLSLMDFSDKATFLTDKFPFGVNISLRKEDLEKLNGFDSRLGRTGTKLLSGEETALVTLLKRKGAGVYYDPSVVVYHHIPKQRLKQTWFTERYYWGGYSEALMWQILDKPSVRAWVRKFAYYIYGFLRNPIHVTWLWRSTNDPDKFWFKCTVHARIGYIAGLFDPNK